MTAFYLLLYLFNKIAGRKRPALVDPVHKVRRGYASSQFLVKFYFIKTSEHAVYNYCVQLQSNSYLYIEKRTYKIMCEVCYRAKRDKKEAT